ncbi:MAG: hypothetical protein GXO16_05750 [Epsilonproteobacteria bacterium]|nr:hypothetical protein [Campylobacterota bacterium]
MKTVGKWLLYLLLFILFFAIFMPKKYLYYAFEHEIGKQEVIISDERIEEGPLSLTLHQGTIFVKGAQAGEFDRIALYPDILYNLILIFNMRSSLVPDLSIQEAKIFYTPFYPLKVFIKGQSSLGPITGEIDLKAKRGFVDILSPKPIPFMKSIEKGRYRYEFGY